MGCCLGGLSFGLSAWIALGVAVWIGAGAWALFGSPRRGRRAR